MEELNYRYTKETRRIRIDFKRDEKYYTALLELSEDLKSVVWSNVFSLFYIKKICRPINDKNLKTALIEEVVQYVLKNKIF